jgi:dihydroorotase
VAVADGSIDVVATDHAPHAVEEKEAEFDLAPPGTIGPRDGARGDPHAPRRARHESLARAIEAMSTTPARILGASDHGGPLEPGRPANLVVFDPSATWVVEPPLRLEEPQQRLPRAAADRPRGPHDPAGRARRR